MKILLICLSLLLISCAAYPYTGEVYFENGYCGYNYCADYPYYYPYYDGYYYHGENEEYEYHSRDNREREGDRDGEYEHERQDNRRPPA